MSGIAVRGLDMAGGVQTALPSDSKFRINGVPVVLLGDKIRAHGIPPHFSAVMVEGCGKFTINGVAVCLTGHKASCGHQTTGRSEFQVEC
ncbi:MAG: hypothetical protein DSY80_08845 [Desulfocapsa sp.]|nr:MAG: hypothetical protein DSY80_08845 [Desulfocapsa sp.]